MGKATAYIKSEGHKKSPSRFVEHLTAASNVVNKSPCLFDSANMIIIIESTKQINQKHKAVPYFPF